MKISSFNWIFTYFFNSMFCRIESSWESFNWLAFSNHQFKIFHSVVTESSALLIVEVNEISVAFEICWKRSGSILHCFEVVWEKLFHSGINIHSFLDFLLKGLIVFKGWVFEYSVIEHMKSSISRVNSKLILS